MYDVLVVGAGFSGSVLARKLAEEQDLKVLLLEQRSHIGGNMYDEIDEYGVLVQRYGPHSLTTDKTWIIEFLSRYGEWFPHDITARSYLDDKYIALPFGFKTIKQLLPLSEAEVLLGKLRKEFQGRDRVSVFELIENSDLDIRSFGEKLFEKAYKTYVAKQWGLNVDQIDRSILNRVQMSLSYDDRYINKDFQYMPKYGFTTIFESMLNHPNIEVRLNCDALEKLEFDEVNHILKYDKNKFKCVIFTGAIDELFNEKYGKLPYRSLDIRYYSEESLGLLPTDIVSYPQADGYTRKTEYKKFNGQENIPYTTLSIEYPIQYDKNAEIGNQPYYPIINNENTNRYNKYWNEAKKWRNIYLCGRLAEYRYYNMDAVIERALETYEEIKLILKEKEC
jgi:UDP-galactopyranose mutase